MRGLTTPQGTWSVQESGNTLLLTYTPPADGNANGILDDWELLHFPNADPGANPPDGDPGDDDAAGSWSHWRVEAKKTQVAQLQRKPWQETKWPGKVS